MPSQPTGAPGMPKVAIRPGMRSPPRKGGHDGRLLPAGAGDQLGAVPQARAGRGLVADPADLVVQQ